MNIMVVGVGGQGTLLTSRIIGKTALSKGFDVKLSEVHGMAQRGGSVVTFVRYGEKVFEPVVEEGCVDILISFERLEAQRYAHFLKPDGKIIVNDCRIDPMTVVIGAETYPEGIIEKLSKEHTVYTIDGAEIAKEITKGVVPVIGSIYVEQYLGDFTPFGPAVEQALKSTDGIMIFDIVHLNKHKLWDVLETAMKNSGY